MADGLCPGCGGAGPVASRCSCGRYFVSPAAAARSAGDPALGRLVLDRFVLLEARVFGARATLYAALDTARSDGCVVKVVRADSDLAEAGRAVAREAELLGLAPREVAPAPRAHGALELPGQDPALAPAGLACLALDEARGVALAALGLDPAALPAVARALLAALGRLHGAGLVHGDLTPAHAFLDELGAVSLVDFGSAARIGDPPDRADGATPAFAAPERGEGPTVQADLFSWGRVIERLGPVADRRLAAAARYATAATPAARPSSAAELLRALVAP
ncbi:MAG: hypothetical protein JNL21_36720 [Myxococcales bacterium]|nr:hypothetical protein [Myxococcales bacterium]